MNPAHDAPSASPDRTAQDSHILARRKRVWRPMLHPHAQRKLPPALQPRRVYQRCLDLPAGLDDPSYSELLCAIDQSPFQDDTQATPFFDGHSAFAAMLEAIATARHEVLLEAYVLRGDATGLAVLEALRGAVARGVDVRVLADAFGSSQTRRQFWSLFRSSGSHFRLSRRPMYAPRGLLPILDHRKLLIVDRRIAFTGGMNIGDEYHDGREGEAAWRDTHVRLHGSITAELAAIFAESWESAGGDPLPCRPAPPPGPAASRTLVLDSRPGRGTNEVFASYAATLGAARQRVWITNAYFAPSPAILELLLHTARRGVEVRLLLPGHCDIPIIRSATQGYYRALLDAGVLIFEYQRAVLHAKTVVADGQVAIIGSTNFDFRSFNFNAECNVLFHDRGMAAQLEAAFERDLEDSLEVTTQVWRARPLWTRLSAWLARRFAYFM